MQSSLICFLIDETVFKMKKKKVISREDFKGLLRTVVLCIYVCTVRLINNLNMYGRLHSDSCYNSYALRPFPNFMV